MTIDAEIPESVSGARLEVTMDDVSGAQALGVSNDFGQTFTTASNTSTVETDFGDLGPSARGRVTLSRYGSRTTDSPTSGFNGQSLEDLTLEADLDDTPLVVRQAYDQPLSETLTEIAEQADAIWEYQRNGSDEVVVWTYPEQRTSDAQPAVGSFQASRSTEGEYQSVTVRGGSNPVRDEAFTSDHGTAVALAQANLVGGSERVYDPTTTPATVFEIGNDYELARTAGEITTLASGAMSDSTDYQIDYRWRPQDTAALDGVTDPREAVVDIPQLTTVRGCGQAAVRILRQVDSPLRQGEVVIPTAEAAGGQWSLVEALDLAPLPFDTAIEITGSPETTPQETRLSLGSRETLAGAIADVRQRVSQLAERS